MTMSFDKSGKFLSHPRLKYKEPKMKRRKMGKGLRPGRVKNPIGIELGYKVVKI